jgi:flavin-dependent dehydrogenase
MDASNSAEFEVVVVGGGPSSSTLAAVVAMRGHRVLVLDSERFPRYQIGESLLPSTIHGCLPSDRCIRRHRQRWFRPQAGRHVPLGRQSGSVDIFVCHLAENGRTYLVFISGRADEIR